MKYPVTFNAAVLVKHDEDLQIKTVTFDGPLQAGQVLVKIAYTGICGKQIEEIAGTRPDPYLPHLLGHEGSGVVVDIGPGVRTVRPGDVVVLHWMKGSGIDALAPEYSFDGKKINAGPITTFNEYGVISENRMTVIPKDSDLRIACLLGCAVTTGLGVIWNEANVRPGESVAVFGCGGVGLNAIQAAGLVNAYPVIAVDTSAANLKIAQEFGATHTIDANTSDVLEGIDKITENRRAKYVIIALADPKATELAVEASAKPGTVYFVGVPPQDARISVNALDIHRLRTLVGHWGGNITPDVHIPLYMNLYRRGKIKLKELITSEVSLADINVGLGRIQTGGAGRCIVSLAGVKSQEKATAIEGAVTETRR